MVFEFWSSVLSKRLMDDVIRVLMEGRWRTCVHSDAADYDSLGLVLWEHFFEEVHFTNRVASDIAVRLCVAVNFFVETS